MGCNQSIPTTAQPKPIVPEPKKPRPLSLKKKSGNVEHKMVSYEEELLRREREREKILHEILAAEKSELRNKALPMIERRLSCENLLEDDLESTRFQVSVTDSQKQIRRKQAKQTAEVESKWMVMLSAFYDNLMITNALISALQ
jgi:hypothetical protein